MSTSLHRPGARRKLRNRTFSADTAGAAMGEITPGCQIFNITDGAYSLIDVVLYALRATGPAHVTACVWSAATQDTAELESRRRTGEILSLRYLLDHSFPQTKPEWYADLLSIQPRDGIRLANSHVKFILIRNERWNVSIITSANLNRNIRMEFYELSDDFAMAEYLEAFTRTLWNLDQGDTTRTRLSRPPDPDRLFSDEALGRDMRRQGLTFDF